MFRLSQAALKTYAECPKRYQFMYIDQLGDKFKKVEPQFVMGQHVHNTLKKLLAEVPENDRTRAKAHELLRQVWRGNRTGFSGRDEEVRYGTQALSMIDTFLSSLIKPQVLHLEHTIQFLVTPDIMVSGRVDRLDQDSSGAVHLIDYKTGVYNPSYVDKSQLAIYSVLVRKGMELPLVSASYWYLDTNQFESFYPTETDLDAIVDDVKRVAERIRNDKTYPALPSHVWKWCQFIAICPDRAEALDIKNA